MVLIRVGGNRRKNSSGERGFGKKRVVLSRVGGETDPATYGFESCWGKSKQKQFIRGSVVLKRDKTKCFSRAPIGVS